MNIFVRASGENKCIVPIYVLIPGIFFAATAIIFSNPAAAETGDAKMNVMQQIPAGMIRKMRNKRFSVTADGVLLYADPILGRLENETKQLVVALNFAEGSRDVDLAE